MTELRRFWLWGVMEYEHPQGVSEQLRELLRGRPPRSAEEQALLDGYDARAAAYPPVPQRAEYRDQ